MKIGYFCYNLSGTGPRVRAQDVINGFATRTDHDVVVLTSEPDLVSEDADIIVEVSVSNPLSVFRQVRHYFSGCDVVHVPINVYQVAFVRLGYRGPLVAGVGPGLQYERRHQLLMSALDVDARVRSLPPENQFEFPIDWLTIMCTATINPDIFHPYGPEKCETTRKKLGLSSTDQILLYVGTLNKEQGAGIINDMAKKYKDDDTSVVVAGDGPLADRITDNENIRFEGFVENKQLPNYYNAADLTLGPRQNDVTSNVGLESIACGTPYITTAKGTIRNLFLYEDDIYCWADRTPEEVWRTAQRLLNKKSAYNKYVERGLEAIAKRPLTLDDAISAHRDLYNTLIAEK